MDLPSRLGTTQFVILEPRAELVAVQMEISRQLALVPARLLSGARDQQSLHRADEMLVVHPILGDPSLQNFAQAGERLRRNALRRRRTARSRNLQHLCGETRSLVQKRGALETVAKLANVSRPSIIANRVQCLRRSFAQVLAE